jgi:hypothetical protein
MVNRQGSLEGRGFGYRCAKQAMAGHDLSEANEGNEEGCERSIKVRGLLLL